MTKLIRSSSESHYYRIFKQYTGCVINCENVFFRFCDKNFSVFKASSLAIVYENNPEFLYGND